MTLEDRLTAWLIRHLTGRERGMVISTGSLAYWLKVERRLELERKR